MSIIFSQIPKLIGIKKEDVFHIHKILGISCLIHYIYRIYQWITLRRMTFDSNYSTLSLITMHCSLSLTSLFFHIPNIRNPAAPMIYPEFRDHSILFAIRSILVMYIHWCFLYAEFDILNYKVKSSVYRSVVVIATIFIADIITKKYKNQGSTMRAMPFPSWIPISIRTQWNLFYSICQVFATLEVLMRRDMSHSFMVLFPIQLAAFLMTCVRKGIITSFGWHIYYTLSLLTTMTYSLTCVSKLPYHDLFIYKAGAVLFIIGRFTYHISKYEMWSIIIMVYNISKYSIFL